MSSCLSGGGGRTYSFDLDAVKISSSSSARSSHSSSPSSTLSESSSPPPLAMSIKKSRAPRKRPNQTYNEAAALLSAIYPNIFPSKSLKKPSKNIRPFYSFPESSDLLPPFPVLNDAAFLIHQPQPEEPAAVRLELKHRIPVGKECTSPVSEEHHSPDPFEDDFVAESILDEEVEQGIDSIMGNLSMDTSTNDSNIEGLSSCNSSTSPLLRSLMGCRMDGRLQLGLAFRFGRNLQTALRKRDEGDWWRSPAVPVRDITPNFSSSTATLASEKKKKKKKKKKEEEEEVDKEEVEDMKNAANATSTTPPQEKLQAGLGLKLSHEEVLKAWADGGSMFSDGADSPNSSADALARLVDIDLFPDTGIAGGVREASVLRYKEKHRTRLFDRRPRMKTSVCQ